MKMKKSTFIAGMTLIAFLYAVLFGVCVYFIKYKNTNSLEAGTNPHETALSTSTPNLKPEKIVSSNTKIPSGAYIPSGSLILNNFPAKTVFDYQIINNNKFVRNIRENVK
jgi:hypothetical protein